MKFYERYVRLRTRLNPFRFKQDGEMVKTVGIIEALMNRALVMNDGAKAGGKMPLPALYPEPEGILDWAEDYIRQLEEGGLPFYGLYTEPGMSMSDHSMIEKDGRMHMFYNRVTTGYAWWEISVDTIGHAVSDDLIHWEIEPIAIATEKGRFDDYQTWSPAVVQHGDLYYMFYTGCNINVAQAPCLAVSKDLYHWEHVASPLFLPGDWCPWDKNRWSNARDSMVFKDDDGTYYMYYCTSKGTFEKSQSAMGLASSQDLLHWKDEGATLELYTESASESPYVVKHNGKYYMFFTDCDHHGTGYAVSDHPLHGWKIKPGEEHMIIPDSVCASEVFQFKGQWYISYVHWIKTELVGVIGFKELFWEPDGFRLGRDLSECGKNGSTVTNNTDER